MFSRGAIVAFAVILAEFVVFGLVVRAVGLGTAVMISFVAAALGWLIMRRQLPALADELRHNIPGFLGAATVPGSSSGSPADRTADTALLSLAGFLLIIPGVVTAALGLLLLLPPIRALIRGQARTRVAHLVPSGLGTPFVRAGVVDVDLFTKDTVNEDTVTDETVSNDAAARDGAQPTPPELG